MAYTPTVWQTGDTITAEKLNKLENGVANVGGYDIVFTSDPGGFTADGASFEELLSGGDRKASYVSGNRYLQSISFDQVQYVPPLNPKTVVTFAFFDAVENTIIDINLSSDGNFKEVFTSMPDYETENVQGTYTYSNGHYVFTLTGEGGGVSPQ